MPTVRKSVIVPHPCATMFDLVERCERYPEFLPWCAAATVFERTRKSTRARLDIDYHGLRTHITTLNRKHAPDRIDLEFVDGPFRHFTGAWRFSPLGEEGCRVELSMDYAFDSVALEALLGKVFGYITATLVDRFVERANEVAK
ncbi:MAG TPA: type II toxin-antitoxin system RatA family toxin [Usitatibacter sp.]|nr:type II toxin-antitoxin system RatA family toxin [Usitatibacter sp.]